ncbi:4'-phosphopantetheinyl transferase family protein [Streptomyces sp. NPDC051569]|uniref:4'-phosphopantetheinyl transferase family protein n=1 Tax=Streptomyces sp. NPDC051569 TaxID=3365661 RepID=UPI0037BCE1B9
MRAAHVPLPASWRVRGPEGPWHGVRADLARTGTALVHSRVTDWASVREDESAMRTLLGHEAPRWARMPRTAVRGRFGVSRLLLKHALGAVIGAPPAGVELAKRPAGGPYARGCDRIEVSLSHTDDIVLVGLGSVGPIGVDVERADRSLLRGGLEREICTPAELAELHRLPPELHNTALVRTWTLKEAYSKAVGQGLRFPFGEFGFTPSGPAPRLCGPGGEPADSGAWRFRTGELDGDYTAAVAVLDAGRGLLPDDGAVELIDHEVALMISSWSAAAL